MNPNQEQSRSIANVDQSYSQVCNSMAKVSAALHEDPLTHLAAIRKIGVAQSHLEIAANHIDDVYRSAKEKDREILMLQQRIKQLDDIIDKGKSHNEELIKRLNAPLSIDEVQGFFRSEQVNGMHEALKMQIIDSLRALKEAQADE